MNVRSIFLHAALITAVTTVPAMADFGTDSAKQLDRDINATLRLENSWHTNLHIDETPEQPITVRIPIGNMTYTLALEPKSIRTDDYILFMQDDEGELYEVPAGPVRTLRGSITELSGSIASASLLEDGLYARIRLGNGEEVWLEPIGDRVNGASDDLYAVYYTRDIIPSDGVCGAEDHMHVDDVLGMLANYSTNTAQRGGEIICTAQLGVDTDYEYYQDWGSGTEGRIESVINSVNVQYEDEVQISHLITTIIVRSTSSDPYNSSDAEVMLSEFGNEWNNNQGSIPRDVAHMFTGKNTGSTIGIAWLGVVCYTGSAYSLVQSDCCGSFGCTTDLSAHELGHNWGAGHVTNPSYNTMYPSIQCANLFASSSITAITSYANSSNCLSCANNAPTGACCISNNQCFEMPESNCNAGNGSYEGDNVSCADASCVDPEGACCIGSSCTLYTVVECSNAGGSYAGDNTTCASVSCSPGACCIDQSCSVTLQIDCSGSWFGEGTTCADITCGAGADHINYETRTWSRSDGQSMVTYDLYFPSTDPNTIVTAVFGNANPLEIHGWTNALFDGSASSAALHQSAFGDDVAHDRALDGLAGIDLVYDSYVTIGSDDAAIGAALTLGFDTTGFNGTSGVVMNDGLWFIIPDNPIGTIGAGTALGHRVGSFSIEAGQGLDALLNVQWNDGAGDVHQTIGLYWSNEGLAPACDTDINGDNTTDVNDLLGLIDAWGPCNSCIADIDGNGTVDVDDLLMLISGWGPC